MVAKREVNSVTKLAAIDIGSNAVRLMLSRAYEKDGETIFVKESLIRIPIRLGEDVFSHQRITDDKARSLIAAMEGFKHLIHAYRAADYIACATSAMREATNGASIASQIRKRTGINIEIIDGKREASIIYSSHIGPASDGQASSLFIDVGGGSTEVSLMSRTHITESASFKIGTVRILQKGRLTEEFAGLKAWLKAKVAPHQPRIAVGTGGSINNIFRLSGKREGKLLSAKEISTIRKFLNSFSVEERIKVLGLRPDRADVIVEAADIYLSVMRWTKVKKMFVPIRGLADALIQVLYEESKSKRRQRRKRS